MKTKKSTWLLIWDLLPENKSVDLYRYNALGNDDGDREETLQDSCSDMIASFNNILATVMTQLKCFMEMELIERLRSKNVQNEHC